MTHIPSSHGETSLPRSSPSGAKLVRVNVTGAPTSFHVPSLIDEGRIRPAQYTTALLCALLLFVDGFDIQAISYAAPLIAKEWHLSREVLGPIFSSALIGLMIGSLVFSPLSDRLGHRRLIVASALGFAITTFLTSLVSGTTELLVVRFLTGLGVGSAVPSAVALTSEYAPKRHRATFVLAIYCGFSLGFTAAGAATASLLPHYGWRSLFWLGAVAPMLLCVSLYLWLPESLDFLIRRGTDRQKIVDTLARVAPELAAERLRSCTFTTDALAKGSPIRSLFENGRATGTVLLWVVFFLNLATLYALQSWLPTILIGLKYPLGAVALATSLSTVGGIVVAIVMGPAMDRIGAYRSLATLYLLGVVFVVLMGAALLRAEWMLLVATFFAGVCVSGGQKSVIALATLFYPSTIRSTGVGWALGIGRLGGIGGPLLFELLLSLHLTPSGALYASAIPMLVSGCLVGYLGWRYSSKPVGNGQVC
jgi:MFS transporter, AAHS family, 4-hydroxybenzoate transporter